MMNSITIVPSQASHDSFTIVDRHYHPFAVVHSKESQINLHVRSITALILPGLELHRLNI